MSIETRDLLKEIDAIHLQLLMRLEAIKNAYDIVIIDAPPAWDLYAEIALIASDYLITPSDLSHLPIKASSMSCRLLKTLTTDLQTYG